MITQKCGVNNWKSADSSEREIAYNIRTRCTHELWVMVAYRRWQACISGVSLHRRNEFGCCVRAEARVQVKGESVLGEVKLTQGYSRTGPAQLAAGIVGHLFAVVRLVLIAWWHSTHAQTCTNNRVSREPLDHARCPNFSDDDKKQKTTALDHFALSLFATRRILWNHSSQFARKSGFHHSSYRGNLRTFTVPIK